MTAEPVTNGEEIKDLLIQQLYSPVLWEDTVKNCLISVWIHSSKWARVSVVWLIKKVNRRVKTYAVQDEETCVQTIEALKEEAQ